MGTIYLLTKFWLRFCSSPRSLNLTHLQPELKYSLLSLPRTGWPQDKIFSDLLTIPQGTLSSNFPTLGSFQLFVLYKRKIFCLILKTWRSYAIVLSITIGSLSLAIMSWIKSLLTEFQFGFYLTVGREVGKGQITEPCYLRQWQSIEGFKKESVIRSDLHNKNPSGLRGRGDFCLGHLLGWWGFLWGERRLGQEEGILFKTLILNMLNLRWPGDVHLEQEMWFWSLGEKYVSDN